jgi:hypothetical protein
MAYCWKCGRKDVSGRGGFCAFDGGALEQFQPGPTAGHDEKWAIEYARPLSNDELLAALQSNDSRNVSEDAGYRAADDAMSRNARKP